MYILNSKIYIAHCITASACAVWYIVMSTNKRKYNRLFKEKESKNI